MDHCEKHCVCCVASTACVFVPLVFCNKIPNAPTVPERGNWWYPWMGQMVPFFGHHGGFQAHVLFTKKWQENRALVCRIKGATSLFTKMHVLG